MGFKESFLRWWKNDYTTSCPSVGGQAVMEGVMMKGPKCTAITVRKSDGTMTYITKPNREIGKKHKWLKIPIIRGIANFGVMLVDGMKTLTDSADMAGLDAEEPTAFEKKLAKLFHCKPNDVMMTAAVILAVLMAIGLFVALPYLFMWLLRKVMGDPWLSIVYGLIRICLFLGYVYLVSRLKEIKRVFMYHGAEHKSICCFEKGLPLTVKNVKGCRRFHPRCGTSFIFVVIIISILVSSIVVLIVPALNDTANRLWWMVCKIFVVLPVVTAISYEFIRYAGKHDNVFTKILSAPGLWMQRITTAEPTDDMMEVAIASILAVIPEEDRLAAQPETQAPPAEEAGE